MSYALSMDWILHEAPGVPALANISSKKYFQKSAATCCKKKKVSAVLLIAHTFFSRPTTVYHFWQNPFLCQKTMGKGAAWGEGFNLRLP